jgi:hypothetical protein
LFVQNYCKPLETLSSLLRKSTKTLTKEVLKTKLKNCIETIITILLLLLVHKFLQKQE